MAKRVRGLVGLIVLVLFAVVSCSADGPPDVPDSIPAVEEQETEPAPDPAVPTVPSPTVNLVDAVTFAYSGGLGGHYFTTPSGLWRCAILSNAGDSGAYDQMAGCQPKASMVMDVAGAPQVPDHATGRPVAPNAILVGPTDNARFASLSQALFWREDGTTPVLAYGQTLMVNGFSCNVQQFGVSCRSDSSGKGFRFSTDGYTFEYVEALDVAADEPAVSGQEPVLGRVWGPDQQGYGEVRPSAIYNGGSLSGLVENIVWQDWGSPQAEGSGISRNVGKSPSGVADAPLEPVVIVGFDLGDCDGTLMYRSLVWYFPNSGETFDSVRNLSTNPCQERPYDVPGSASSVGNKCGVVTAADGIARDVVVSSGSASCADIMAAMNATYPTLYDKPLDYMEYGKWYCTINPAGEVLFSCVDSSQETDSVAVIYRSLDDPYR
ncbi:MULTISPECIES: hypothetical protein [unclassified Rhodococcus (in: high G+C Gram-positive bacteria)]|uniref:hypothetical protein n=1 Tax=unclassified Rhodococcus (in: high G+C Gram-positive bacteria) TaxID=192944 RepID=UPI00113FC7DC|nr:MULTISPECIES: hypothetical protein [unclassified Rhodococcus (in: high G+C Gram-positive bacteria)]